MFMWHRLSSQKWSDLSAGVFLFFSISIQNICLTAIFVCIIFLLHLCAFPLVSFYLRCIKSFDLRIISRPSISSIGVMWEEHQPSSPPNPFIVISLFFSKISPFMHPPVCEPCQSRRTGTASFAYLTPLPLGLFMFLNASEWIHYLRKRTSTFSESPPPTHTHTSNDRIHASV